SLTSAVLMRPQRLPLYPYTTLFRSRNSSKQHTPVSAAMVISRACIPLMGLCAACLQRSRYVNKFGVSPVVDIPRSLQTCGTEARSEEHTSELQSRFELVCRLLLDKQ